MILEWKYNEELCSIIQVDYKTKSVSVKNNTEDKRKRAFHGKENPDFKDFEDLLERRCFPRNGALMKLRLEDIGLDHYNPIDIVAKTNGEMAEDNFTLTIV